MAKLEVLKFPDQRLRKVGVSVRAVTKELQNLAKDMLETMYAENGIGLAAPQVGQSVRLVVIDTRPRDHITRSREEGEPELTELESLVKQPLVLFNPELIKGEGNTTYSEGCLSVPSFYEDVDRFDKVHVRALDVDGRKIEFTTDGLLAICIQHEMDHLEGKLFIDRISFAKSSQIKDRIRKHGYPEKKGRGTKVEEPSGSQL